MTAKCVSALSVAQRMRVDGPASMCLVSQHVRAQELGVAADSSTLKDLPRLSLHVTHVVARTPRT